MLPAILLLLTAATRLPDWKPMPPETASAWLGFSGATLSIRSVDDAKRPGTARRQLTLILPSGATRTLPLQDGGGHARNHALNLYHIEPDHFLLVSSKDCVEIDPIKGKIWGCVRKRACAQKRIFAGRFDWMNGFDRPRGKFEYGFRFLPDYDVGEDEGC